MEFFEAALGKPTSDKAVIAVVEQLGGVYVIGDYASRTRHDYDPDVARSRRWEFTQAPDANFGPTHLRELDGVVVAMSLNAALVSGGFTTAVTLELPVVEESVLMHEVTDGSWPPSVNRRGDQYLLDLWVPFGHWEGRYRFPLTPDQVEILTDRWVWQQVWDALVEICQSRRFFDDPSTLPGDAQLTIDRICRRA